MSKDSVVLRELAEASVYTFLALLSWYGHKQGSDGKVGAKLFEDVCAHAAANYLGGPDPLVKSYVFGFPRRVGPAGFKHALDELCRELGEGEGHRQGRPKMPNQKDGKLDVVVWRDFVDKAGGKLISFGQCATGADWTEKVTELPHPEDWCSLWMADRPGVHPFRSFFVPHRVGRTDWFDTCVKGGVLFDRCRIAGLARGLDQTLASRVADWSSNVLTRFVRKD